jgi:RPA family protein
MDLAVLVRDLAKRGVAQRLLAKEILESVIRFSEGDESNTFLG